MKLKLILTLGLLSTAAAARASSDATFFAQLEAGSPRLRTAGTFDAAAAQVVSACPQLGGRWVHVEDSGKTDVVTIRQEGCRELAVESDWAGMFFSKRIDVGSAAQWETIQGSPERGSLKGCEGLRQGQWEGASLRVFSRVLCEDGRGVGGGHSSLSLASPDQLKITLDGGSSSEYDRIAPTAEPYRLVTEKSSVRFHSKNATGSPQSFTTALRSSQARLWVDADNENLTGMRGGLTLDFGAAANVSLRLKILSVRKGGQPNEYDIDLAVEVFGDTPTPERQGMATVTARAIWYHSDIRLSGTHEIRVKTGDWAKFDFDLFLRRADIHHNRIRNDIP